MPHMSNYQINPVMLKELRGRMRGPRSFVILTIYALVLSLGTLLVYIALVSNMSNDLNAGRTIGRTIFFWVSALALLQVAIFTPALTAGAVAGEKERQTYDLLVASLLSPWQIVWGKLVSAVAFGLLLVATVLPLSSLGFIFGGVTGTEFMISVVGLLVTAMLHAAIGMFWSSVMRSTLGATVISLGLVILNLAGIPFLAFVFGLTFLNGPEPEWIKTYWFIYLTGAVLCLNPFVALGLTAFSLSSNDGPLLMTIDSTKGMLVLSPWIGYTLLALLLSALLIWLTVRMLRPDADEGGRGPSLPRASAPPAQSSS